jgi:hypothetical protein
MINEAFYLDLPFFYAISKIDNKYEINILRDYAPGSKASSTHVPFSKIATFGSGESKLYVWYNGHDHYHSFTGHRKLPKNVKLNDLF